MPAYVRKKILSHRREFECTCDRMIGKSPNVQFGIRFSTWSVGQGTRTIGNDFKFLWSGGCKVKNGAGIIVANWLIGKVVGVERLNDKVMKVNILIGNIVSCYCP